MNTHLFCLKKSLSSQKKVKCVSKGSFLSIINVDFGLEQNLIALLNSKKK